METRMFLCLLVKKLHESTKTCVFPSYINKHLKTTVVETLCMFAKKSQPTDRRMSTYRLANKQANTQTDAHYFKQH